MEGRNHSAYSGPGSQIFKGAKKKEEEEEEEEEMCFVLNCLLLDQ
jgi:hypothetical protein